MNVVSLFSGLGGLDKGFADTGYNIVWANDFDKYAVQTYKANFGDHIVLGDINEIPLEIIPDCDILIGGFPCQPFSMMGQQKGFEDTRGTLFFRIAEIVDDKMLLAFLLLAVWMIKLKEERSRKRLFLKMSALYGLIIMEKHIKKYTEYYKTCSDIMCFVIY